MSFVSRSGSFLGLLGFTAHGADHNVSDNALLIPIWMLARSQRSDLVSYEVPSD